VGAGADPTQADALGLTPLMLAEQADVRIKREIVNMLTS